MLLQSSPTFWSGSGKTSFFVMVMLKDAVFEFVGDFSTDPTPSSNCSVISYVLSLVDCHVMVISSKLFCWRRRAEHASLDCVILKNFYMLRYREMRVRFGNIQMDVEYICAPG